MLLEFLKFLKDLGKLLLVYNCSLEATANDISI